MNDIVAIAKQMATDAAVKATAEWGVSMSGLVIVNEVTPETDSAPATTRHIGEVSTTQMWAKSVRLRMSMRQSR